MAYCTAAQVKGKFKKLSLDDGTLTTATLEEWIDQSDAYINSKIGMKYVVPVTATEGKKVCTMMSLILTTEMVRDFLKVKTGDPEKDQDGTNTAQKQVDAMLKEIVEGTLLLSGATLQASSGAMSDYNSVNDVEHIFKTDEDQW